MIDEIKREDVARVLPPDHIDAASAYVVEGWPWGRRLRCRKRFWIESKPKHGQRLVAQTTMPPEKNAAEPWCKPHAGVYSAVVVIYLDTAEGHVHNAGLSHWGDAAYEPDKAQVWLDTFREGIDPKRVEVIEKAIARGHERKRVERVQRGGDPTEARQPPARSPEARAVRIWDLMDESERAGVPFALFPLWASQAELGGKAPGEGWEAVEGVEAARHEAVALMALAKERREAVTG